VLTLDLPPLRARGHDVLLLAERFLGPRLCGVRLSPKRLDADARARLLAYEWPGNIRELGNAIERAAVFTDTAAVTAESLGSLQAVRRRWQSGASDGDVDRPERGDAAGATGGARGDGGGTSRTRAAKLGIARNTVYARVEKFGLRPDHPHKAPSGPQRPAAPASGSRHPRPGFDGSSEVSLYCVWI